MRNFAICSLVLFATAGRAFGKEPRQPPPELALDLGHGVKLELVAIPAGEFLMGSPEADKEAFPNEKPQHRVRITKPFCLGKYLVTQEQWEAVMEGNPSHVKGPKNPVENVNWFQCRQFLAKLGTRPGQAAEKFQLPTEAQWEYACRAGSTTRYYFGDDAQRLGEYACYWLNSFQGTHPVGEKKPNAWGLYDMHGNVWEWCADWWDPGYYANSPPDDPTGPARGSERVLRGGCWSLLAGSCRSAYRYGLPAVRRSDSVGFRVARVAAE
jgi:formylglycine-generating enzyme required for sulfatase activity